MTSWPFLYLVQHECERELLDVVAPSRASCAFCSGISGMPLCIHVSWSRSNYMSSITPKTRKSTSAWRSYNLSLSSRVFALPINWYCYWSENVSRWQSLSWITTRSYLVYWPFSQKICIIWWSITSGWSYTTTWSIHSVRASMHYIQT